MVYDAEGARIVRVEEVAGSETITSYVPGLFERRDVPVGVDQTTVTYSFGGSMIGYRVQAGSTSDERYYTVTDHLGSSAIQLRYGETSTSAATRQFYTPFGDLRGTASNQLVQDRTFTGQIEDGSTGLMFYNARYYDPMIRRFVSPDTIIPDPANPQDFNRYSYVSNNPVLWVDPGGNRYCPPNDTACDCVMRRGRLSTPRLRAVLNRLGLGMRVEIGGRFLMVSCMRIWTWLLWRRLHRGPCGPCWVGRLGACRSWWRLKLLRSSTSMVVSIGSPVLAS